MTTLGNVLGNNSEDNYNDFDLTEIQDVLKQLQSTETIDLFHAERLQQTSLRGADLISEYLGKISKTIGFLESKLNRIKNEVAAKHTSKERVTADVRKAVAESSPEVEEASIKLSRAKAAKILLDKKFDIIVKAHYYYKDIAAGYSKTLAGYKIPFKEKESNGWTD